MYLELSAESYTLLSTSLRDLLEGPEEDSSCGVFETGATLSSFMFFASAVSCECELALSLYRLGLRRGGDPEGGYYLNER